MSYRMDVTYDGAVDESHHYDDLPAAENALMHTLQGLDNGGPWRVDIYNENVEPPELVERVEGDVL